MLCTWLSLSNIRDISIWKLLFENIAPHYVAQSFLFKGSGDKLFSEFRARKVSVSPDELEASFPWIRRVMQYTESLSLPWFLYSKQTFTLDHLSFPQFKFLWHNCPFQPPPHRPQTSEITTRFIQDLCFSIAVSDSVLWYCDSGHVQCSRTSRMCPLFVVEEPQSFPLLPFPPSQPTHFRGG